MNPEVQEDQQVTISCSVESWPLSELTLTAEGSSKLLPSPSLGSNVVNYTFIATPDHRGTYTCRASNSEGSNDIKQQELVVKCTLFTAVVNCTELCTVTVLTKVSMINLFCFARRASSDLVAAEDNWFRKSVIERNKEVHFKVA